MKTRSLTLVQAGPGLLRLTGTLKAPTRNYDFQSRTRGSSFAGNDNSLITGWHSAFPEFHQPGATPRGPNGHAGAQNYFRANTSGGTVPRPMVYVNGGDAMAMKGLRLEAFPSILRLHYQSDSSITPASSSAPSESRLDLRVGNKQISIGFAYFWADGFSLTVGASRKRSRRSAPTELPVFLGGGGRAERLRRRATRVSGAKRRAPAGMTGRQKNGTKGPVSRLVSKLGKAIGCPITPIPRRWPKRK